MKSARTASVLGLCCVAAMLWPGAVGAQLLDSLLAPEPSADAPPPATGTADDTVLGRARPGYDPPGLRASRFVIRPQVTQGIVLDTNPLGAHGGHAAPAEQTQASVQAVSDFSRNGVAVSLGVDDLRYLGGGDAIASQSRTDWQAAAGGFYEIGRDRVLLDVGHAALTEQRTDIGVAGGDLPLPYTLDTARLAYRTAPGGLSFEPNVKIGAFRYGSVPLTPGEIPGQYRDRNVFEAGLITRYRLAERRDLVLSVEGAAGDYLRVEPGQPSRDYSGVTVLTGIDYGLPSFYRVRLLGGLQTREFTSGAYKSRVAPVAEAEVVWSPSRRTTVTGTVTRRIEDSAEEASQGYTYTRGRVQVDHEARRNVLLQGYGQIEFADYLQNGQTQSIASAGASATWLLDRHLKVAASYVFQHSRSNLAANYDRSLALLQFTFAM